MTELWPLRRGAKMCAASKNDPNLTITLPIITFQYFSMGISGVGQKLNLVGI